MQNNKQASSIYACGSEGLRGVGGGCESSRDQGPRFVKWVYDNYIAFLAVKLYSLECVICVLLHHTGIESFQN